MSISPTAPSTAIQAAHAAQTQAPSKAAQQQPDTVQLSQAAQAHLRGGGDTDGDGDGK